WGRRDVHADLIKGTRIVSEMSRLPFFPPKAYQTATQPYRREGRSVVRNRGAFTRLTAASPHRNLDHRRQRFEGGPIPANDPVIQVCGLGGVDGNNQGIRNVVRRASLAAPLAGVVVDVKTRVVQRPAVEIAAAMQSRFPLVSVGAKLRLPSVEARRVEEWPGV